jgi:hypothetical protein
LPADISRRSTIKSPCDRGSKDGGTSGAKQDGGNWFHRLSDQIVSKNDTLICYLFSIHTDRDQAQSIPTRISRTSYRSIRTSYRSIAKACSLNVSEGRCGRSPARSAWNSLSPKEPSRRARYDRAETQSQRSFVERARRVLRKANHSNRRIGARTGANQTVPYGTALLRSRCPRHFVPGYDRTVPPGLEGEPLRGNKSSQTFLNLAPFNLRLSFCSQFGKGLERFFRGTQALVPGYDWCSPP